VLVQQCLCRFEGFLRPEFSLGTSIGGEGTLGMGELLCHILMHCMNPPRNAPFHFRRFKFLLLDLAYEVYQQSIGGATIVPADHLPAYSSTDQSSSRGVAELISQEASWVGSSIKKQAQFGMAHV
jgi:hypothetical protein